MYLLTDLYLIDSIVLGFHCRLLDGGHGGSLSSGIDGAPLQGGGSMVGGAVAPLQRGDLGGWTYGGAGVAPLQRDEGWGLS